MDRKLIKKIVISVWASACCVNCFSQNTDESMVLIPSGSFVMGKNTSASSDWQPEHKITISSFFMDKKEVTNSQYYDFCVSTNNPLPFYWGMKEFRSGPDFPDYPVVGITYFEAEKYARWAGKRLPTEAEWEYAARGGLTGKSFPFGDQIDSTKVNYGRKYKGLVKVGSFPPNGFGLSDITGNAWEWTSDFYSDDYYSRSPAENPKGPETGRFKVIRGGSWHSGPMCVQTFYRNGLSPSWVDFAVGFRCVKDVK
jgi:formylglycine-generating enzyme required for sulfatase activity